MSTDPQFFTTKEIAERIPFTQSSLETMRCRGDGPPYYKRGKRVVYCLSEVLDWLTANRHVSAERTPEDK